jgi:hypothetical protein
LEMSFDEIVAELRNLTGPELQQIASPRPDRSVKIDPFVLA